MHKQNIGFRLVLLIAGVLLVAAGLMMAMSPAMAMRAVSILLGLILIVAGIVDLAVYFGFRSLLCGVGWMLANGLVTLLLGVLVLFNKWITAVTVPVLFSVWILFTGVATAVRALDLHHFHIRSWLLYLVLGLLQVVLGVVALFQPLTAATIIGILVGVQLMLRGVDVICTAIIFDSFYL